MLRQNQKGFHHILLPLIIVVIVVIGFVGWRVFSTDKNTHSEDQTQSTKNVLPDISYYQAHKSDQFLVDMNVVQGGSPYLGQRAISPHNGGHVLFGDDYKTWPRGGSNPQDYPSIYAVADGIVDRLQETTPVDVNDKYDIAIEIANGYDFEYSIEPFVKEPSRGFYKQFIMVKNGDHVKKGQIIAHMYLPNFNTGTHIHFDIMHGNSFMAPAIFTPAIVQAFHDRWNGYGRDGEGPNSPGVDIAACTGYKLTAAENPFSTGAEDCLN